MSFGAGTQVHSIVFQRDLLYARILIAKSETMSYLGSQYFPTPTMHYPIFVLFAVLLCLSGCSHDLPADVELAYADLSQRIDFNQHIRPILSDRCWSCHGPDEGSRQAGLRLDTETGAFAALTSGNGFAFKPGSVAGSEAIARMTSDDPELVMPTPESKLTVSPREIALIAKWVEQGAEWKDHWAFLPILDPEVPANPDGYAAANPVDHFINTRLAQEKMTANERAGDERLLRRVYLDLTGLPPTPEQLDDWLADPSDKHYAAIVDELLTTDAHAERLAVEWLDLARYADSHGMHADGYRTSYPYRDWVLAALKKNMPFDDFIRQQVAGDLIPEATREQRVASAFNRMHPITAEGGVIDEEMRLTYVFDRVNTVATGMLGLTMDCSRCHDHKFDPLAQAEYYGFSAFFNNFNELGMTGDDGDFGPYMLLPDSAARQALDQLDAKLTAINRERSAVTVTPQELEAFLATESVRAPAPDDALDFETIRPSSDGQRIDDIAWATTSTSLIDDPERGRVVLFDNGFDDVYLDAGYGVITATDELSASIYVLTTKRDSAKTQTIMGTAGGKNHGYRGQDFYLDDQNRLNFRLIRTLSDDAFHVRTTGSLRTGGWRQVGFTYDGSGRAAGVRLFIDGELQPQQIMLDNLRGSTEPVITEHWLSGGNRQLRLGQSYRSSSGENGIFVGRMDELKLWNRALSPLEMQRLFEPDGVADNDAAQYHLLTNNPTYKEAHENLRRERAAQLAIQDTLVRLMIAEEMQQPRQTYRLDRGAYDARREEVFPTTPAAILPFPEDFPKNRLGLAEWMLLPENPLTARVAVNRYWQLIFGRGLVSTPHDFGSQGTLPTHPQLLDYLATDFRESGWDIRALLRQMVLSETYRRSSKATPGNRETDSDNLLLARGPSGRMPAEMIRDNALAASGLLVEKTGGPSVRPYQPDGLWIQANNFSQALLRYVPDHGDKLYRRSIYTFNKRTAPPPFMTNFDVMDRSICSVERSNTNTPLQALNLLNDPQFVETARVLAQRVQAEAGTPEEQLTRAFRLVAGRKPVVAEQTVLARLYEEELARFTANPVAADSLLAVGEYPVPDHLDRVKTAALASVGNVLFSFDEAYVKR